MITKSNYEIYFVDYFDGKLDESGKKELFQFLENNADLKSEFESYSTIINKPDVHVTFKGKEALKKNSITLNNIGTWLIREFENDLNPGEKKELEEFLNKNPNYKTEREKLKHVKSIPDYTIIFKHKSRLKKGEKVIQLTPFLRKAISIAAIFIILLLSYFIIRQQENRKSEVAEKETGVYKNESYSNENASSNSNKENTGDFKNENHLNKNTNLNKDVRPVDHVRKNLVEQSNSIHRENKNNTHSSFKLDEEEKEQLVLLSQEGEDESSNPVETNSCQDYPVIQNHSDLANNTNVKEKENPKFNETDIFSESELQELADLKNSKNSPRNNSMTILQLAKNELKDVVKSANVTLEKKNYIDENSVYYAFSIKNKFTISYTSAK